MNHAALKGLGILKETTGRRRDRTHSYARDMKQLRQGTELPGDDEAG